MEAAVKNKNAYALVSRVSGIHTHGPGLRGEPSGGPSDLRRPNKAAQGYAAQPRT